MSDTFKTLPSEAGEVPRQQPSLLTRLYDNPHILLLTVGSFLAVSVVFAKTGPMVGWHPLGLLQWAIIGGAALLWSGTLLAGVESGAQVIAQLGLHMLGRLEQLEPEPQPRL